MQTQPQFTGKGHCHGINLVHRGRKDNHALVQIFTEDDGTWNQSMSFSNHWLPELIKVLQAAQKQLERKGKYKNHEGYCLPNNAVVDNVNQIYSGDN